MLDSNFIWSPARGQWVAKSTPSSARPTATTSATSSSLNTSPRKQQQQQQPHSARSSSQSLHLPNVRNQPNASSSPSATTTTPASRLHTASSAERGIFRTDGISQVGRVTQLFSDSHRAKESTMNKASSADSINPPAPSSLKRGTSSTRNVAYSYDQYNFVPVPGLSNHGIDGVACDEAERAMIGKKYVSREEMAAVELLKREQKKKDAKKSLAVKASISEIDRFSQQQRCAGDSDDSDPSPDDQQLGGGSTSNHNNRGINNKRFSTSPGGTKRGGAAGGAFGDATASSAQGGVPVMTGAEMGGGNSSAAAAQQAAPIPTESRLLELAGAYIHSLAIDCSTEELVMLYFRVVCGLDYGSAHRTSTAAVSQLLSDEIDQLHSSHHMLGVPPGSIPITTRIGTSSSSCYSTSDDDETTDPASSANKPSSPRGKASPSSPKKQSVAPLTGSVIASPTARRSTAPNNNNGATPLKPRSGSWARSNNRASVVSTVVDEVFGDKQHSSEILGVNGGGKAPTLVVSGGDVSPTTTKRKVPSQPPSAAASPTSVGTKKVGFSNNFQFGLNTGDDQVPLHIDSNKQSFAGETANKKSPPPSIVKSSALAFAASPKQQQQINDDRPEDGEEIEEDPLDSADPQRQYLIAGVPNPLSSNSISLRLATAFSTHVADVVKSGKTTATAASSSTEVGSVVHDGASSSATAQRAKSISAQKDASVRLLSGKPTHNSPRKPQTGNHQNATSSDTTAATLPPPPSTSSGPPASREEFLLRGEIVELMADSSVSGAAVLGSCYDIGNYHNHSSSPLSSMPYMVPTASRRAVLLSRQQRLIASLQRTRKASHGAAWNAGLPSTHMSSLVHHNNTAGNAPAVLPSFSVSGINRPAMPLTEVIGPTEFHQLCTACILYGKEKKRRSDTTSTGASAHSPSPSKNRLQQPTSAAPQTSSSVIDAVELCMVYHALKEEIKERVHLKEQDEEQVRISIIELQELEEQRQRALAGCGTTMGASAMAGSAGGFTAFPMMLDLGNLQGDGSGAFTNGDNNNNNNGNQQQPSAMEAPLSSISNSSDNDEEEDGDDEEFAIHADASDDDSPFSSQLAPVESASGMLVVQKKRLNSPGYGDRTNQPLTVASPTTSQAAGGGPRKKKVEKGSTLHSILTMQRQRKVILEEIENIKESLRIMEAEERAALAAVGGPVDVDLYDSTGSIAIPTQQTATQLGFERLLGIYRPPALMGVNADEVSNGSGSSPLGGPMSRRGSTLDNRSFGSMADISGLMRSPSMNSLAGGGGSSSRNLNKLRMLSSAGNGGSVTEESLSSCNVSLYSIISTLTSVSRARADTKRRVAYFVRSFMPQNGWPLSAMFLTKEDPEALLRQQRAAINTKARMSLAPGSPAALQAAAAAAATAATSAQSNTITTHGEQLPPSANANIIASISNKATQQQQQQLQRHILQLILSPNPQTQSATAQLISLLGSATGITDYNNHKMVMAALGPFLFNSTLLNEFLIAKTSASSVLRGPSTIQASIFKRLNGSVMRPLGGGSNKNNASVSLSVGANNSVFPHNNNNTMMVGRNGGGGGGSTATSINGGGASPHSSIPRPPYQPKGTSSSSPTALSPQRLHENSNHFASPAPRPPPHSPQHTPNFLLRPHFSHITEESSTHMLSTLMMGGGQPSVEGNHPSARSGSAGGAGSRGVGGLASTNNGGGLGATTGTSSRLSVRRSTLRGTNRRQSVSVLSPTNSSAMMSHRASISGTVPNSPSSTANPGVGGPGGAGGGIGLGGAHRHQQQLERTAYFLSQCVPANIFNPHFLMYFIEEHLRPLVKVVEKISITTALPPTTPSAAPQSAFNNDTAHHQQHQHDNNNNHTTTSASFSSGGSSPSSMSGGGGVYPISAAAVNAWLTLCEEYLLPLSLLVLNRYYDVFAALPDWKAPTPSSSSGSSSDNTTMNNNNNYNGSKQHSSSSSKSTATLKSKMMESIRSYLSQKNESVRGRYDRNNNQNNNNNNNSSTSTSKSSFATASKSSAEAAVSMLDVEEELLASISPDLRDQFMASIDPFVILLQTSVTHVAPRNSREYNVSVISSTNKGVDEFAGILSKNQPQPPTTSSASASPPRGGTMPYGTTIDQHGATPTIGATAGAGPTTEALEVALGTVDGPTLAAAARTLLHYGNNGAGGLFGDGSLSGTNKEASAAADLLNTDMLSNNYGGGGGSGGGGHHHHTPHHNTSYSFHSGGNKGGAGGGVPNPFAPGFEATSSSSSTDVFGNHIKPVMIMTVEAAATMCLTLPVLRHFFENAEGW